MSGYNWSQQLAETVDPAGTVVIPAPGVDDPKNDLAAYEVVVGANVMAREQATVAFDTKAVTATVTNGTPDTAWPAGTDVVVAVPGTSAGEVVGDVVTDLDARVTDLDARVTDLEARVTALEEAEAPVATSRKKGKD
jgi:hypothetical protein